MHIIIEFLCLRL